MPKLPLVGVLWKDAHGDSVKVLDKDNVKQDHKPWEMVSYGLLLHQDEDGVTLMSDDLLDDSFRGNNFIPGSLIKEVWLVSSNPRRKRKLNRGPVQSSPEDH